MRSCKLPHSRHRERSEATQKKTTLVKNFSGLLRRCAPRKDGWRYVCVVGLLCHVLRMTLCIDELSADYFKNVLAQVTHLRHRKRSEATQKEQRSLKIFLDCHGALRALQGRAERCVRDWIAARLCKPLARTGGDIGSKKCVLQCAQMPCRFFTQNAPCAQ